MTRNILLRRFICFTCASLQAQGTSCNIHLLHAHMIHLNLLFCYILPYRALFVPLPQEIIFLLLHLHDLVFSFFTSPRRFLGHGTVPSGASLSARVLFLFHVRHVAWTDYLGRLRTITHSCTNGNGFLIWSCGLCTFLQLVSVVDSRRSSERNIPIFFFSRMLLQLTEDQMHALKVVLQRGSTDMIVCIRHSFSLRSKYSRQICS